ncbi:hypothetical protein Fmac_007498 [Flemingia macrophylla]|uniref:Transmembrane protein n=1 Tax=Flemingia macrophylla TaxID=520843 RepID=A0ABD1MVT8_9FABA
MSLKSMMSFAAATLAILLLLIMTFELASAAPNAGRKLLQTIPGYGVPSTPINDPGLTPYGPGTPGRP